MRNNVPPLKLNDHQNSTDGTDDNDEWPHKFADTGPDVRPLLGVGVSGGLAGWNANLHCLERGGSQEPERRHPCQFHHKFACLK